MKIASVIITLLVFIALTMVYFAWVGSQLTSRTHVPNFTWPF